ncbi:MAG: hypothetical protein R2816_11700 [Flavobacteriaceae bacterium]
MNLKKTTECERTKLESFLDKFQLPNVFKKIGLTILALSFLLLTIIKFTDSEPLWARPLLKQGMLIGLLIISISREKIEDELIQTLRSKSYSLAFIIGVIYIMLQPLTNQIVNFILGTSEAPDNLGYVQVLLFMLLIQVGFFEVLKRNR